MTNLKHQLFSGVMYSALSKYAGLFISLAVTGILARLLPPSDFGTVSIATVLIQFFSVLANAGIASAIIQHKELGRRDINEIYMATLWIGGALSVLVFALAGPAAAFYHDPRLLPLCRWLSASLFLSAASVVPNTLFYKEKRFRYIARRTLAIQAVTGIFAIGTALSGMGIYSLLVQPLLSNLLIYMTALKSYPQQWLWTTGINSLKRIGRYSLYQFLFDTTGYFTRNLDKLLVGKFMGMQPLAYYEKSYRLMTLPLQNVTYVITPVLHPLLSDYRDDAGRLAEVNGRISRLLAFIGFPLSALFFFSAPEWVICFFGSQWQASVPLFRILSLSVGFQLVLSSSGSFYQAGGYTKGLFLCGLFGAAATMASVLCGIFLWGSLSGTAVCMVVASLACFVQCYWLLYRRLFRCSLHRFYRQLAAPFLLGVGIAALLWLFSFVCGNWPLLVSLIVKSALSLLAVIGYLHLTGEYPVLSILYNKIGEKP